jgi:predicted RNA-binding Zn ribbon-like protein
MATAILDELQIVAGHPALDLANTLAPRLPDGLDYLPSPAVLLAWAGRIGLVDRAEAEQITRAWSESPGAAEAALADVLTLRALIDPVLAGHDLDALTWRWAEAVGRSALVPAPGGAARLDIGTTPALTIPDRLADALVDLLRNADLSRLRSCPMADGGCGWLFLDRSRNGSRRWCSMGDCGTQVKSRRLTERRRARHRQEMAAADASTPDMSRSTPKA